jgi:geranylgeranyl reductase family protein
VQHPLEALPADGWDVVIAGAGPAGSVAALTLARLGWRVLLADRARFPRHKVCGDALIPDALRCLEDLGLLGVVRAIGHDVRTLSLYSAARIRLDVPGRFITLKRRTFDALLAREAIAAGATFVSARVTGYAAAASGATTVTLASGTGPARALSARAAIVATGADVDLLGRHGLVSQPRASAMALRCYVRSDEPIDELVISYDRAIAPGYAWIFPMGGGEYNVGCGTLVPADPPRGMNLRRDFEVFTSEFPLARALMRRARAQTRLEGARLRCGLQGSRARGPGFSLAAGEAIGATFPLTGEGIGKAMETGRLAAESLAEALASGESGRLARFDARLAREIAPKYLGYATAERWLEWPRVGDFVVGRATRSPYLRRAIAGILDETVDPRTVFSARGVLRSWFQ